MIFQMRYLKPNQLRNVTIIDDARSAPASPTSKDLVKMFEEKEEKDSKELEKKKKENRPATKKLKNIGKLNAKFANLNIHPGAHGPHGGTTKIRSGGKEGGEIDQKPKVEQAVITSGRRKKRKKKKILLEEKTEQNENGMYAPQLFYKEPEKPKPKPVAAKSSEAAPPEGNDSCGCVVL
eukprot:UN02792